MRESLAVLDGLKDGDDVLAGAVAVIGGTVTLVMQHARVAPYFDLIGTSASDSSVIALLGCVKAQSIYAALAMVGAAALVRTVPRGFLGNGFIG